VNRAAPDQLEALPAIGRALAIRIIEERRRRGSFVSMADLLQRVDGLGDQAGELLQGVLAFSDGGLPQRPVVSGALGDDLRALLALSLHAPGRNPLEAALEEVAMHVARHPHPQARIGAKRDDLEPGPISGALVADSRAARVTVLADKAYYPSMVDLIRRATQRVDVCMFYIALPTPTHPTHQLLEALARKAAEGCAVRVLVDQDGKGDRYGSRLINAAAVAFLASRGVEVRADPTETLLHSKFVVLDGDKVAIGSHNWTAGSFFHYADVSVLMSGAATAQCWQTRFETLWARGRQFEPATDDQAA
jgi:phosphatidylserine/phosphatidylglycerophosphate/cardiolipin synthase-like enzyme